MRNFLILLVLRRGTIVFSCLISVVLADNAMHGCKVNKPYFDRTESLDFEIFRP